MVAGWVEVVFIVDSGASETVVGRYFLPHIPVKESWGSLNGVEYRCADGMLIPNRGEKQFIGVSKEAAVRTMTVQVTDVAKPLLSVQRATRMGHRVVFDGPRDSFIENKLTGERIHMDEENGVYTVTLKVWREAAAAPGFARQVEQ